METGLRIRKRRQELGLNAVEIALKIGISPATMYRYEKGGAKTMPIEVIKPLSEVLLTTPEYLMGWDDNVGPISIDKNVTRLKIYGRVPAGVPISAIEDFEGYVDISKELIEKGGRYIALKVKGDSMYPFYIDGDIIIVKLQPDCESGEDAVVYVNGYDATLKTVIKNSDGSITLKPKNPVWKEETYTRDVRILGVVVESRRSVR